MHNAMKTINIKTDAKAAKAVVFFSFYGFFTT